MATYMYLHYLQKSKAARELATKVDHLAARNASEQSTKNESVEWINFLIKHWYLYCADKLEDQIKEIAQPLLDDMDFPSPVTGVILESFSFGQSPPHVEYAKTVRDKYVDDPTLQSLELVLGPRIRAEEFELKLHVKGIGNVVVKNVEFKGELEVVMLLDKKLPFPGIRHVYFTFQERPEINFDVSYGLVGMDVIPTIKTWILDTIEEVVSDTLVDPGRFLIDLSKQPPQTKMITGVRKLKRTALNIQVDLSTRKAVTKIQDKKVIRCDLSVGGRTQKSYIEFYSEHKTLHIWFPLTVLQEEIRLIIKEENKFSADDTIAEMVVDVNSLVRERPRELSRVQGSNMVLVVKATAFELPYIPIRQSHIEVTDFSEYFKNNTLTADHVRLCPGGLVYLHIHRACGLSIKDSRTKSSDPYCTIKVNGEKLFKTKVVDQNLNPVFNHFEDFFVSNAIQTKLTIEVFDHDKLTEKDEIGVVVLALGDIVPMMVNQGFSIVDKKGKKAGTLFLSVIFRPIHFAPASATVVNSLVNNLGDVTLLG